MPRTLDEILLGIIKKGENLMFYHHGIKLKVISLTVVFLLITSSYLSSSGFSQTKSIQTEHINALIQKVKRLEVASPDDTFLIAMEKLWKMGRPAVAPLITALDDKNWFVRWCIAMTLGNIGDPAVKPLIALLEDKNKDFPTRWMAAAALLRIERYTARNISAMDGFLKEYLPEGLLKYSNEYKAVIEFGDPQLAWVLLLVLAKYGTKTMAEDFLNCGYDVLVRGAKLWVNIEGYIELSSKNYQGPRWGSRRGFLKK